MQVTELAIPDVKIIRPARHADDRGFFSETYSRADLARHGIANTFVQDNHAFSRARNTVRGLHFQIPPFAQAKLVRVVRGAILDVAVDLRVKSPSYGRFVTAVISAAEWNQILVPVGFAHGLLTLEPDTEVLYKVSSPYSRDHDKGVLWNDPEIGIPWGVAERDVIVSDKDRAQPRLSELPAYFQIEQELTA